MSKTSPFWALAVVAALGMGLSACGGGGSDTADTPPPVVEPEPTPYETATAAIAAATTADAAQAAYDAVKDDVTAAQGAMLQAKVDARIAALATMDRAASQRMALMTAAGAIDTSDLTDADAIAAANTAIAALKAAIAAAVDVDDTSMYQGQVDAAETAVADAQSALDHTAQTAALSSAVDDLQAIDLTDLSTQAKIDAANTAIAAVRDALEAATELSAAEKTMAMTEVATADRTVMMAQGRFDIDAQKTALAEAVATLAALDLDSLMTQAQIDAAVAAITGLNLALEQATDLTDAEKLNATVDVTVAQRKVDRAEETLTANVDSQRTALMKAVADLAAIDLEDLDTAEKIAAANEAVEALKTALEGATHLSDAEKTAAMTDLNTATETVRTAQTGMDRDGRMMTQRTAITNAVTMARTAVNGVTNSSTDSEVSAADQAITDLEDAIAGAVDLEEGDTDVASAQGTLTTLKAQLNTAKTARTAYLADKADDDMETAAKLGKDLHAALADDDAGSTPLTNIGAPVLATTGLTIDATTGAGALATADGDPAAVELKAGASAGSLGDWAGANYAHTHTTTKVVNEARVYNNKGPGKTVTFAKAGYTVATATSGDDVKGYLTLTATDNATLGRIGGAAFENSGTTTHSQSDREDAVYIRGTYDGAPGEYRCTGTCTVTNDGKGSPSALGGTTWHFKPDAGAMVVQPDANYLYYGWWVSKDKDGVPTAASAFAGTVGDAFASGAAQNGGDLTALTGSATYAGNAAGKFAIDNPLDGTGNGGHFTADASLSAKFSGTGVGITGTIDNFRLNDGSEDAGWSVSLHRAGLGTDGAITAPVDDTSAGAPANVDESLGTTWSINGNSARRSGTWSGTMYDELPGLTTASPPGDGSNIPTTVTGTFYSEFSTIGRMVGAFGAEKQ